MNYLPSKATVEVNERRLKGIYDQLESGTLKKAIAEADKVLKKNPNLLPAKVLKGLAQYRSGKTQESFSLINEVVSLSPSDESTLSTISYFFRESNQKNRIVDLYEVAYKQFPNREDICINLFYCYIKTFNYLSQQKVAIQLKKINPSNSEYGMWPMIGNVLHGVYNKDLRLVKLGEAMLTKYFNSDAILSAERIEFLIFIFDKLNKVKECYEWLSGSTLKNIVESDQNKSLFDQYKIDLLLKLERYQEAALLQLDLINMNCDNIRLWTEFIDNAASINLDKENPTSLASIVTKLKESDHNRISIKVAAIHLSIVLEKVDSELYTLFGSKVDKIFEYYERFGDRSSCFYDIYTFLCMDCFTSNDKEEILRRIFDHSNSSIITNNKEVERLYLRMALKRAVKGSLVIEEVKDLLETYHSTLPFSVNFGQTEIKPCDNFIKLVVSCYYDKWLQDKSQTCALLEAVSLLKKGIAESPANYNLRLQLSHIYGLLCCQDLLFGQFNDLEIKQLMWDSLGHHYILPVLSISSFVGRTNFLTKNLKRKQRNKLEIEENLVTCYKLGNYGRIPEIVDFHHAIDASVMSCMSEAEILYFNTVIKSNSCDDLFEMCGQINLKEVESSDPELNLLASLSYLEDYRDLKTSPDFAPFERSWTSEDQTASFKHIVLWIAQRHLVLRAYFSSAKLTMETVVKLDILSHDTKVSFAQETSNYYKVLVATRRDFLDSWSKMSDIGYNRLYDDLTGCVEPPNAVFTQSRYPDIVVACIDCIISFHDTFVRKTPSTFTNWNVILVSSIKDLVQNILATQVDVNHVFETMPLLIAQLTVLCEMVAVITMTIVMTENMTKPIRPKQQLKRKNKRKVDVMGDMESNERLDQYKQFLDSTKLNTVPSSLMTLIMDVEAFLSKTSQSLDAIVSLDFEAIVTSWKLSLDESVQLLTSKKTVLVEIAKMLMIDHDDPTECVTKVQELKIEA